MFDPIKRYDDLGQRTTNCCGVYSTYMDDGTGDEVLCCKKCYGEVSVGEGDGTEFKPGVSEEEYWNRYLRRARQQVEGMQRQARGG